MWHTSVGSGLATSWTVEESINRLPVETRYLYFTKRPGQLGDLPCLLGKMAKALRREDDSLPLLIAEVKNV
jgi:hypothetical protein